MVPRPLSFPVLVPPSRPRRHGVSLLMEPSDRIQLAGECAKSKILCVDDDETVLLYTQILLGTRFEVSTAASGAAGLELMASFRPDWVVVDYQMPGMDGAGFMRAARDEGLQAEFILLTGLEAGDLDWEGLSPLGLKGHMKKPMDPKCLAAIIEGRA